MSRSLSLMLLPPLAAGLLALGGCGARSTSVDPSGASAPEESPAYVVSPDDQLTSPAYERARPTQPPRRGLPAHVVVENPPIDERFLYDDAELQMMVSDVVSEEQSDGDPFDAVAADARSRYSQAAMLDQTGYGTQALRFYIEAVERDPDNLWLKNRAAIAALQQNDLPRSQRFAEEVLEADNTNITAMLTLATLAQVRNRRDDAIEWYGKILDAHPRQLTALENLARMSFEERDYEATKEYCARIMQVTSRNLNAILWHAESSALTGDITHAATLYAQLIRYRPTLIARVSEMGIRLMRQGRTADAIDLFRSGVEMQPENESIRLQWETLVREIMGEDALHASYKDMADSSPLDLRVQELYAQHLLRSGRTEELVAQRLHMLEVNARHIPSLISLARIRLAEGNTEEATRLFEAAIAAGPSDAGVYREIALVYMEQGSLDRAGDVLRDAIAVDPNDAETYLALAGLAQLRQNAEETERHLRRALDLSPANERVLRLLGAFYREQGKLYEASQILEQLIAVVPRDLSAQLTLATIYHEQEDAEALDRQEAAVPRQLDNAGMFHADFGMLAFEYADWDRARRSLERSLDEFPGDLRLRSSLARVYLQLGEPAMGEKALLDLDPLMPREGEGRRLYLLTLMQHHSMAREPQKALEYSTKLLEQFPEDISHYRMHMSVLADLDRMDDVRSVLSDAVRRFATEDPTGTQRLRADAYRLTKELDRAVAILRPLASDAEVGMDVRFELALIAGEQDRVEDSEKLYLDLIRDLEREGDTESWLLANSCNNLAYLYAQESMKLEKAEELALRALSLSPNSDFIMDTVGWVYFQQGRYAEAEKMLLKAERYSLPDAEVFEHLGDLYGATGEDRKALAYYRRALDLTPDSESLREKHDALSVAVGAATESPAP